MSFESKYKPDDYVRLRSGESLESRHNKVAKLRLQINNARAWKSFNKGKTAGGIWEKDIKCKITKEEYEKQRLAEALK